MAFVQKFYQTLKELTPIVSKLFHKTETEETSPSSFYEAAVTLIPKLDTDSIKTHLQTNLPYKHKAEILNKILTK